MRHYELMLILDPDLEERTVAPSLDQYLNLVRQDGGEVSKVDIARPRTPVVLSPCSTLASPRSGKGRRLRLLVGMGRPLRPGTSAQ